MKNALGSVPGVQKVDVDFESKSATVSYDAGQANGDALVSALVGEGYQAKVLSDQAQ